MKPSEILDKAQDEIRDRGWHQGDYVDRRTGSVCALGAIRYAAYENLASEEKLTPTSKGFWELDEEVFNEAEHDQAVCAADDYAFKALNEELGNDFYFIPTFNDLPETSAEDVLLMLKRGAEAAREEGQ